MGSHAPHGDTHPHGVDPQPIDPLHDIDARRTVWSVVFFTLGVFFSMWLLAKGFAFFLEQEHQVKVYDREATELKALRATEHTELQKTETRPDGTQRISIDEAMRRLAAK
jgi:cell division protein FtsB